MFQEFLYRHKLNTLKYFATVHKIPRSLSIIGEGTFYEWFKSIFTMRDEDIEDSYGEDALQYLRFQRYVIGYLMFVSWGTGGGGVVLSQLCSCLCVCTLRMRFSDQ